MRRGQMGRRLGATAVAVLVSGCGSTGLLHHTRTAAPVPTPPPAPTTAAAPAPLAGGSPAHGTTPGRTSTPQQLGFPYLATKNTTRVAGEDPTSDAAAVAMSVFPSAAPGTHPGAVVIAPTDSWPVALAAASAMGAPFRAPLLLSGPSTLPTATLSALDLLAPTGEAALGGAKLLEVGDVPAVPGLRTTRITGADPAAVAANLATYEARRRGGESRDVVITSSEDPADAMPAAGWVAQSGEPLLYVTGTGVPAATAAQLRLHHHPRIYVLDPPGSVGPDVIATLRRYGTVHQISAATPAAESVAFTLYRDPPCPPDNQQCAHLPGSFGWAIRTPGHGFVLVNDSRPLDAAASAALSSSGAFGPQLVIERAASLPGPVLSFFLDYATPGYSSEGPTAAVYNHAWLIGDVSTISEAVQAQVDSLLEPVPARVP